MCVPNYFQETLLAAYYQRIATNTFQMFHSHPLYSHSLCMCVCRIKTKSLFHKNFGSFYLLNRYVYNFFNGPFMKRILQQRNERVCSVCARVGGSDGGVDEKTEDKNRSSKRNLVNCVTHRRFKSASFLGEWNLKWHC